MSTKRPANEHMSEYHKGLIDKVPDCDLMNLLKEQTPAFVNFIEGIPPEQSAEITSLTDGLCGRSLNTSSMRNASLVIAFYVSPTMTPPNFPAGMKTRTPKTATANTRT